jgi:hypothetical protein
MNDNVLVTTPMEPLKQFPIPKPGHINIVPRAGMHSVSSAAASTLQDHNLLMGFSLSMRGRFGEFRFEHAGVVHPKCRFDSDSAEFVQHGPDNFSVTLPITVLP